MLEIINSLLGITMIICLASLGILVIALVVVILLAVFGR